MLAGFDTAALRDAPAGNVDGSLQGRCRVVSRCFQDGARFLSQFGGGLCTGLRCAGEKLDRVLQTDPGMGVIRHADAGYERAIDVAEERGVRVPMREEG